MIEFGPTIGSGCGEFAGGCRGVGLRGQEGGSLSCRPIRVRGGADGCSVASRIGANHLSVAVGRAESFALSTTFKGKFYFKID